MADTGCADRLRDWGAVNGKVTDASERGSRFSFVSTAIGGIGGESGFDAVGGLAAATMNGEELEAWAAAVAVGRGGRCDNFAGCSSVVRSIANVSPVSRRLAAGLGDGDNRAGVPMNATELASAWIRCAASKILRSADGPRCNKTFGLAARRSGLLGPSVAMIVDEDDMKVLVRSSASPLLLVGVLSVRFHSHVSGEPHEGAGDGGANSRGIGALIAAVVATV